MTSALKPALLFPLYTAAGLSLNIPPLLANGDLKEIQAAIESGINWVKNTRFSETVIEIGSHIQNYTYLRPDPKQILQRHIFELGMAAATGLLFTLFDNTLKSLPKIRNMNPTLRRGISLLTSAGIVTAASLVLNPHLDPQKVLNIAIQFGIVTVGVTTTASVIRGGSRLVDTSCVNLVLAIQFCCNAVQAMANAVDLLAPTSPPSRNAGNTPKKVKKRPASAPASSSPKAPPFSAITITANTDLNLPPDDPRDSASEHASEVDSFAPIEPSDAEAPSSLEPSPVNSSDEASIEPSDAEAPSSPGPSPVNSSDEASSGLSDAGDAPHE